MRPLFVLLLVAATVALPMDAQQLPATTPAPVAGPSNPPSDTRGPDIYGGYMIGVGDILDIRVADEEMMTGRYQVDQNGALQMPLLSAPVRAAGATTFQLAQQLQNQLKTEK